MSDEAVLPIEGTEGVEETALFVSPNGEWVGSPDGLPPVLRCPVRASSGRDETLWKTRIDGGIPVPILESREIVEGAQWVGDDTIFFRRGRGESFGAVLPIEGTEGVEETALFVSPNGEWVGFYRRCTVFPRTEDGLRQ